MISFAVGLKITLSWTTFLVSSDNNINSCALHVPTIFHTLLQMTSNANELPLEKVASDYNIIHDIKNWLPNFFCTFIEW